MLVKIKYALLSNLLLYRIPILPARSIIRGNLNLINYLKVALVNIKYFRIKFRYLSEKGIWLCDDWSENYFHWTFDSLPKLFAISELDDCTNILLPERISRLAYVIDTLTTLGYEITTLKSDRTYLAREVIASENINYFNKELLFSIRASVFRNIPLMPEENFTNKNIYISRHKASRRRISNEIDVTKTLEGYDFTTYFLEDMTWKDQVNLFRNSKIIVAMHGAGLSNILYGEKLKGIIELRPSSSKNRLFKLLADELFVPYREVILADPNQNVHDESFFVEDESLKLLIKHIVELS